MEGKLKRKAIAVVAIAAAYIALTYFVTEASYGSIGQTQDQEVIALTEEIGAAYGICPELLQAVIFYESSNNPNAVNPDTGCTGYMQVSKRWHKDRMDRLGVHDLTDGYGNILVGTDYLSELAGQHEDIGLVLMLYHGDPRAWGLYEAGELSRYARDILKLSSELDEREIGRRKAMIEIIEEKTAPPPEAGARGCLDRRLGHLLRCEAKLENIQLILDTLGGKSCSVSILEKIQQELEGQEDVKT